MIFLAILLVGGAFVFAEYRNKKAKAIYSSTEIAKVDTISDDAQKQDSDGDSIPDWEEILLGTDPKDPKSKAVAGSKNTVTKDLTKTPEKLDQIDTVSREFFARYMELRQMGLSKDKTSQEDLALKTASGIVLPQSKVYKTSDILIKTDISKEVVKQYGNEVGIIFKKYSIKSRNEAVIAKDAMDKENPEILKEIDPIILSYKNILNNLLKVKAPQTMSQIHLDLVNSVSSLIFVAELLKKSGIDPIAGLQGTGGYLKAMEDFNSAFNAVKSYLTFLGITYTAQEGGIIFISNQ
ncbi:MAG: thrombospondin type 3 repeat-containing protein [Patescibacteria group bacterium]